MDVRTSQHASTPNLHLFKVGLYREGVNRASNLLNVEKLVRQPRLGVLCKRVTNALFAGEASCAS